MAFTIEPGIYIRPAALDKLPETPENRAFKAESRRRSRGTRTSACGSRTRSCSPPSGPELLSKDVPRTVAEIEELLAKR